MVKNNSFWRGLAIAVILLFIGLAIAPSINACACKDNETVEYTTEICGLNSRKRTVRLPQEEDENLERLLENVQITKVFASFGILLFTDMSIIPSFIKKGFDTKYISLTSTNSFFPIKIKINTLKSYFDHLINREGGIQ